MGVGGLGVGWEHTIGPKDEAAYLQPEAPGAPLAARILALLSDPRVRHVTATTVAQALGCPRVDAETTLDAMAQAGSLQTTGESPSRSYHVPAMEKQRLESLFREAAQQIGETEALVRTTSDDGLVSAYDDDVEEPRLPLTAGMLSIFLPGTGQLLNGDIGRASLVFAVWSLAWITHLTPVIAFVQLYAGAEAFFTAKIRSMERRLARESAAIRPMPPRAALPAKPTT